MKMYIIERISTMLQQRKYLGLYSTDIVINVVSYARIGGHLGYFKFVKDARLHCAVNTNVMFGGRTIHGAYRYT